MTRRELLRIAGGAALAAVPAGTPASAAGDTVSVVPAEDTEALLHNPDMGWVVYENYPLDQGGGSTLVSLPGEDFAAVDAVALMFSWADVEKQPGEYDFSKVDFAYDHWRRRGKQIQLRVSTESLLWWARANPPAGTGVPDYVLRRLPADKQQTRTCEGLPYTLADAREPYYLERLERFLAATAAHFSGERPVALVDLRGFGLWGEWPTGYQYASVEDRRAALIGIIDRWSAAFPRDWLALSYSYDPDGPKEYYAGPTDRCDAAFTKEYQGFVRYSAFDHALAKSNVTLRRDGVGGAVHSNERRLCEEAFRTLAKGPMMSEFLGGYGAAKKGGDDWLRFMVRDALSVHPNYVCLMGWQCADARDFMRERPDLIAEGLRTMGYRLVPTRVTYPRSVAGGKPFRVEMEWVNRGVGRAMRDYRLKLSLADARGHTVANIDAGTLDTHQWIRGSAYKAAKRVALAVPRPGRYELRLALLDPRGCWPIALPLAGRRGDGSYRIGPVACSPR